MQCQSPIKSVEAEQRMEGNMSHSAADCKSLSADVCRQLSILTAAALTALLPGCRATNAAPALCHNELLKLKLTEASQDLSSVVDACV